LIKWWKIFPKKSEKGLQEIPARLIFASAFEELLLQNVGSVAQLDRAPDYGSGG
jgi:hypothetical protein